MLDTPVLFLIFKRPDLTRQVFQQIKKAKPFQLFVAADGPRQDKAGEAALCQETRELVLQNIDWPCEVKTLFREKNVGCRVAVSEAVSWFFEHVEEGIILEDDCLPHQTFFSFCSEILNRYKDDEKIFHISGNNYQFSMIGNGSYYLSRIPHIWGWATWRRAWKHFDVNITTFNERNKIAYFNNPEINCYWLQNFSRVKKGPADEWSFQWAFALFLNKGFVIQPQYNLVRNIGFDERSYRTSSSWHYLAQLKTYPVDPLIHPEFLEYNEMPDLNLQKYLGWYMPFYENRISGTAALKIFAKIIKKRVLKK